jgi:hypothetical protein
MSMDPSHTILDTALFLNKLDFFATNSYFGRKLAEYI